jgi:hypothetical protein
MRVEWVQADSALSFARLSPPKGAISVNALLMSVSEQSVAQARPELTEGQKALQEGKVLPLNSLLHGRYYNGLLDNANILGRWHAQKRRFLFWDHNMGEPKVKSAPHVADLGIGPRFAPLALQESEAGAHISDFAFETTR